MKKPIIGVVLDLAVDSDKYFYSPKPWYALRTGYTDVVEKHGGLPILMPYVQNIESQLDMIDGLIIPGCDEDINPSFYGQRIKFLKIKTKDKRALYELSLAKKAIERDMPIFAICNGLQLVNVLLGGTLIQHIPDVYDNCLNHEQPYPKDTPTHDIIINSGTLLSELTGDDKIVRVNSTHHQAIDKVADNLIVSARAPDGIIEAIESRNHSFLIGVQWHAEYENTELDKNLFKRFIEESKKQI